MTITVAIRHHTRYNFDRLVNIAPHTFRLKPAPHCRTPIQAYSLKVQPEEHFINWQQDPFGNYQARVVFPERSKYLDVTVEVIAKMTVINPFDFFIEEYAEKAPFDYTSELQQELSPYLKVTEKGPLFKEWIDTLDLSKKATVDFLVGLNQEVYKHLDYLVRMEPGVQSCEETLEKGSGSCRDFAWLLVQLLRHLGLAARFVSGYLVQLAPDQKSLDGPSGPEQDFTDLHAWAEVFVPGAGWIGLDATSGLFAGEGHIPLSASPEPASAAPITGATDTCEVEFEFSNSVTRIHEAPRVTKPYSESQWQAIQALGEQVDDELKTQDIRLTMGGEPTFVSIDDMEGPEWNTTADSPVKRKLACELFKKMQQTFSPGALRHFGQGKWYPGEPLPRWQYASYWREDGHPVWNNDALAGDPISDPKLSADVAKQFAEALSKELGITASNLLPAYEDALYLIWQEGQLPDNIDLNKIKLKEYSERAKLRTVLNGDPDSPSGYVLPMGWDYANHRWHSCQWTFRTQRLTLVPGDSPLGLRLPLNSIPWQPVKQGDEYQPHSYFQPYEELPADFIEHFEMQGKTASERFAKTALCVEVRDGRLFVFMPPMVYLEHYLLLVQQIEVVASSLKIPVIFEGYSPPADLRLTKFAVTPDPGVIEVNIHPANTWGELVSNTEVLYQLARESRLGTEKFMLDGRHTGTGGGNHVTMGASSPLESPFLRKPGVLRSLLTFWQHHPGLSYLFSGLFIGPTSQAPRVDEGREEYLYELEIAFSQLPDGETQQPWLVDRLLRHLLVDISGNTHRSEFCIDKMYSPDSATGRLGILEFRGFEMPPHYQMSLVQNLLLRTLLVNFWQNPYHHKLVRWGTELHDRFLLPYFVARDMQEVCATLQLNGYQFETEWLNAFHEFRFPVIGKVNINDISLELRTAIEPWHVLGEEMGSGGTSRFVDSSLERLQVYVKGLTSDRYIISCNGRRLPLHRCPTHGEYVAGVRYRAWQPPSALHPTIGVHSPLVFDIYDTWNNCSVGGCTYHVVHPGGRNFEAFPVNSFEAEGRRIARFDDEGHTQTQAQISQNWRGTMHSQGQFTANHKNRPAQAPVVESPNDEYPFTLDLRRPIGQNSGK